MIYIRKGRGRKSWKKLSASGHKINFANVLRQGDMTTLQLNRGCVEADQGEIACGAPVKAVTA